MKHILSGLLLIAVAACGPIYKTEYTYTPPSDSQSRACIAQCNAGKNQCRYHGDLKAENERLHCELDANADYEHCRNRAVNESERAQCVRRSCNAEVDTKVCDEDFRVCFQTCGGIVSTRQVCEYNCP